MEEYWVEKRTICRKMLEEKRVVDKCFAHFEIIVSSSRTRTRSSRRMLLGYLRLGKNQNAWCSMRVAARTREHNNRELVA